MNKNSEVLAVDAKIQAYLVLVALLEEQGFHQATIFFRKFVENLPNFPLHLSSDEPVGGADAGVGNGGNESVVSRNLAARRSTVLPQHIGANRVDEGPKPFRMADAFCGEDAQDPNEGLLPDIFDGSGRTQAPADLQPDQFAEVSDEVFLGATIAGTKPIQIGFVEVLKLH